MDEPIPPVLNDLGPRLRRLRRERELTLEQVAARIGLSQPTLSRIEAGARQPSLAQLLGLAGIYGVAAGDLLDERGGAPADPVVVPADQPPRAGNGLLLRVADRREPRAALSALHVTVPAERAGDGALQRHHGDEWIYVLSGRLRLTLGDVVRVLEPGTVAHFDAALPHRLDADGDEDATLLLVAAQPAAGTLEDRIGSPA